MFIKHCKIYILNDFDFNANKIDMTWSDVPGLWTLLIIIFCFDKVFKGIPEKSCV